jgi:crotonobetainyl-CoA:carnitine CoA-transferase CaiB-like acyl-CoA transferase
LSEQRLPSTAPRRAEFLAGVRVLELGDGVAGAAATSVLWALGAEVTTVIDLASTHRHGQPSALRDGQVASLLSLVLDRGKRSLTLGRAEEFDGLLAAEDGAPFDLVVVDRVDGLSGALSPLQDVEMYAAFVERHNANAWLTISAFGLAGERAEDVATELTVAAAAGMLSAVRDPRTGQPLKLAGQQSLLNTGQAGALAACHAIDLATAGGTVHLDLSAVEATIAMGPVLEIGGFTLNSGALGGAKRYGSPADFYECTDGLVRISAMEDHQWQGLVEAMASPAWAERFATVQSRIDGAAEVDEHVAAWTRTLSKAEAETLLQSHGVPATAMYSPAEILASPQLEHRGALETLPMGDGREARVVGAPFRVVDGGNDAVGTGRRVRSLRTLRMLEASRVLAVPLCGSILAALGADVTKVEDLPRLDMYRRRGPYIDGEAGVERSAYFALVNHSKASAAFDVDAARHELDELLDGCDVVVENLGAKRASKLGLSASTALATHPDALVISSSGFGLDGPHARYRAYAYNLQASCALGYLTRSEDGTAAEIDIAWADLISAYALATLVAAWAVGPSGNCGVGLDFAMADLIVAHFNEFLAAASLDPDSEQSLDRSNELSPYAPNGVYPTTDGWIALSVDDDEHYGRLAKVLAHDALADPTLASAEARLEQRRVLDEHVGAATSSRGAGELAAELRAAGIAAEQVLTPGDLLTSPHLVARGFFTEVEHPVWGRRRLVGIPWQPFGGPAIALGPPPLLIPRDSE